MMDIIFVRGLEARGIIGIEEWERKKSQTIRIDLEMACDVRLAAASDDIEHTVNYKGVSKAVLKHVEESKYLLVETLAERLAAMIRQEYGVPWVKVRVSKPGAVRFSEEVGVVVERGSREIGS